ncbi:MAG TPA: tetratricopeptide repeat protein, partial [Blastocatellia bacterium]|nr:tetratricopeptide repeat protein [Blastocatellia bacterium]
AAPRRVSPEAYEAYLKGRQLVASEDEGAINRALDHFERAPRLDPGYAPAYAGLAEAHVSLVERNYVRPAEAYLKAKTAIAEALRLDGGLAEAHALLGVVRTFYDRDWPGADSEFRRALQLNPNHAKAHLWYGEYLRAAERKEEAIAEMRRAQSLDPMSLKAHMAAGDLLFNLKRYDEAMAEYRRALAVAPGHALAQKGLGHCYFQKGMSAEAENEYKKYKELTGTPGAINHPAGLKRWARNEDTRSIIYAFGKVLNQKYVRPTHLARIYLDLGERDEAFYWLERAYQERDSRLFFLKSDSGWQTVSHDPRYKDIIERLGPVSFSSR